ncbi:MAG TPA: T9SS type A sorting domain-containing protein [Chitinophagales bacterium]|nr:T9SS type A sorting domain-containing protein [Chitinophagales bacterium]
MKYFLTILLILSFNAACFSQVWMNNGAFVNIAAGTVINGGSLENTSGTITNTGTLDLTLDFTNSATVNGSGNYFIGGNWSNTGTFTPGAGTVTFNGTGTQSLTSTTFNNLIIHKTSGTASLTGNAVINGDLTIDSGTLDISTYASNRTSTGGSLTMGDGAFLLVSGANNFPSAFSNVTLDNNSTVEYNGTAAQSVAGIIYGNLIFSNGGVTPKTSGDSAAISGNITINSGATFIDTSALQIAGTITNSGTFTASNGSIELNGSSAQTIPAATFSDNAIEDLIINNAAGVTLDDTLKLSGVLTPSNGSFATGNYLTLLSTASQTALISGNGSGEVLGNVTMQRYLARGFGYKYLSSPFEAATVNELSDDIDLTDSFSVFYRYDENQLVSGWLDYTDTTGLLIPMQGYAANFGADSSAKTIDITGVVNNGTISSATLYNHDHDFTMGFNLAGNPYPSPVDWDLTAGWTRTNIDDAIYYFNAGDTDQYTGTYSSYVNGISSDSVAVNIIPAMQGFFVHVTDGSFPVAADLTVNNSARSKDLSAAFHRPRSLPLLRLYAGFHGGTTADPFVFYLDDEATTVFNKNLDALKLMNTNPGVPNLYALSGDAQKLSIRALPYPDDSLTVLPLGLKTQRNGSITFNARDILLMPDDLHIYLLDNEKGIYRDLRQTPDYRLYLEAGKYENRFFVVFSLKELNSNSINNDVFDVYLSGGKLIINSNIQTDENSTLVITSMLGSEISSQPFTGNGSYYINPFLNSGMYMVSLFATKGIHSKKIIIAN